VVYLNDLDPLTQSDIELSREASPAEKLQQALELMRMGIRWKRAALITRAPDASEAEIQAQLEQWFCEL
jgi:hypothetical protein